MAKDEYQNAKNSYKKAMLIEKNGLLHFLYGNACFMNDELHEGLENYNIAITEGYDSDEMMFFMGMAYEHLNDDEMAYRYFTKACAKNPSRPDYSVKKIQTLIRLNKLDSATEETEELLKTAPELYDGYHIKTHLLLNQEKVSEAVVFSKAATDKFPEDVDLLLDYVRCLAYNKNFDEAIQTIQKAKNMKYFEDAKRGFVLLEGQIYAESNRFAEAIECCNICTELEEDGEFDGEARFMRMNLYLTQPNYEMALQDAEEIVKKDEGNIFYYAALYYRPFCNKHLGNAEKANVLYKEAKSIYRLATLENPAALDIYLYRVMCERDLEEYDKALELLDFIEGITKEIAEVYVLRADIYNTLGKKAQAESEMQKAYVLKPELRPCTESAGE